MKKNIMNNLKKHILKYKQPYIIGVSFFLWFFLLVLLATVGQKPPYNSTALKLGKFEVAWYAVFILSGVIFATVLVIREAHFLDLNIDHLYDFILIAIPLGIVGARLYYVIFEPVGGFREIINITTGGLAIHGVIITGVIWVIVYTKIRKMNLFALLDLIAIGLIVGQIIGRWGNFFNQEAHGGIISESTLTFFKNSHLIPRFILENMYIDGVYYHPTFLYESLWNFVGLVGLLVVRRKRLFKLGDIMGLYLIWYGLGRGLLIEPFRTDPLMWGNVRVNVLFSLTLFTLGGLALILIKNFVIKDVPYYLNVVRENEAKALEALKFKPLKKKGKKK